MLDALKTLFENDVVSEEVVVEETPATEEATENSAE